MIKQARETKKAMNQIGGFFQHQLKMECKSIEYDMGTGLAFYNKFIKFVITITTVHGRDMIKLEHIEIEEEARERGFGTKVLFALGKICSTYNTDLGLWVEKGNSKLVKWYEKRGFELIETVDDHWLEYKREKRV